MYFGTNFHPVCVRKFERDNEFGTQLELLRALCFLGHDCTWQLWSMWLRWPMFSLQVCSLPAGDILVCWGYSGLVSGVSQGLLPGDIMRPIPLRFWCPKSHHKCLPPQHLPQWPGNQRKVVWRPKRGGTYIFARIKLKTFNWMMQVSVNKQMKCKKTKEYFCWNFIVKPNLAPSCYIHSMLEFFLASLIF